MPRILLIDDCLDLLDLNRMLLAANGHEVHVANSGFAALQSLNENAPPDLILVDCRMPKMSGPEFLLHFASDFSHLAKTVPVVMMSALQTLPETVGVPHLSKSLDPDEFLERVTEYLNCKVLAWPTLEPTALSNMPNLHSPQSSAEPIESVRN